MSCLTENHGRLINTGRLARIVAIKVSKHGYLERFHREARAVAAVNHPNICTIHDVGKQGDQVYIAMEFLEGRTLPGTDRWASHRAGGCTRDSDPDGRRTGGGARERDGASGHQARQHFSHQPGRSEDHGLRPGKARCCWNARFLRSSGHAHGRCRHCAWDRGRDRRVYVSPEQARGEPLDARSDIFSFGATVYEMLTGVRAFRGGTLAAQFDAILHQTLPGMDTFAPGVPAGIERVVAKCLQKGRGERYQTMSAVKEDLKSLTATASANSRGPKAAARIFKSWISVGALALAVISVAIVYKGRGGNSQIRSLVVLPLENISGKAEEDYFTDGMTAQFTEAMMKVRGWRVISRTSAMQYKNSHKPVAVLAKELGVDAVVEGTVQRAGERVRISARLIRAGTEEQNLWAESFDRDLRDVLDLEDEVARSIANQIKLSLSPQEQQQLAQRRPIDPAMLDLYLKGRAAADMGTEEALHQSIQYFEQAIAKDPTYAPAHAALALAYGNLTPSYEAPKKVMPQSRKHAQEAIELSGDTLAEADTALASVLLRFDWDWEGAEREIKHALSINPNSADAHWLYGNYFSALRNFDRGLQESGIAHELDPLSLPIYSDLLGNLVSARQYDRAIAESRRAIAAHPDFGAAYGWLGMAYLMTGRPGEAVESATKARLLDDSVTTTHFLAMAQVAAGNRDAAAKLVKELEGVANSRYACAYEVASVHLWLGDRESAVKWLKRGQEEQCDCMMWLQAEPWMDPLRSDPQYEDMIRQVHFPAR